MTIRTNIRWGVAPQTVAGTAASDNDLVYFEQGFGSYIEERTKEVRADDMSRVGTGARPFVEATRGVANLETPFWHPDDRSDPTDPVIRSPLEALLQACGWLHDNVNSTGDLAIYEMLPHQLLSQHSFATIRHATGSESGTIRDARGSFTFSASSGTGSARMSFSMMGNIDHLYRANPSVPELVTYDNAVGLKGGTFTIKRINADGTPGADVPNMLGQHLQSFEFNGGQTVSHARSLEGSEGYGEATITGFAPSATANILLYANGTPAPGDALAASEDLYILNLTLPSGRTGAEMRFQLGPCSARVQERSDDEGIMVQPIEFMVVSDAGFTNNVVSKMEFVTATPP